jgi:hypothetical protein
MQARLSGVEGRFATMGELSDLCEADGLQIRGENQAVQWGLLGHKTADSIARPMLQIYWQYLPAKAPDIA